MVDDKSSSLSIEVAGDVYEIRQSPGLLTSANAEGTTGAALWKISPLVADWLVDQTNALWSSETLHANSTVVELGCGITGLIGCAMSKRIATYVLTDQRSIIKLLQQNVTANASKGPTSRLKARYAKKQAASLGLSSNVHVLELNWETDDASIVDEVLMSDQPIDLVVVCDCVFNDFLLEPLVNMCQKLCSRSGEKQTVLLIAQQLRSDEVLSAFFSILLREFRVWRISNHGLPTSLHYGSGFAVHIAILR